MYMVTRAILAKPIQIVGLKALNRYISNSSRWIQIWFTSSEPDFFAISKMVHYVSVSQKMAKLGHQFAHYALGIIIAK